MTIDEIDAKRNEPPPMAEHTAKEFQFAERTLLKMVTDSQFFPQRAGCSDWFRPHDHDHDDDTPNAAAAASGAADNDNGKHASDKNNGEMARRKPCEEDSITVGTASTTPTCGDDSRKTIDYVSTTTAAEEEEAPSNNDNSLLSSSTSSGYDSAFLSALGIVVPATTTTTTPPTTPPTIDDDGMDQTAQSPEAPPKEYSAVPSIHEKDVDYGNILGLGGFCEVRLAHLRDARKNHQHQYAIKYLSPTKMAPREICIIKNGVKPRNKQFERGIADLAIEARFLALLSHPNIIGLHYVGEGKLETQFNCEEEEYYHHQFGYFMLLDPLFETLATRIEKTYLPQVFGGNDGQGLIVSPNDSSTSNSSKNGWWNRMVRKNVFSSLPMETWRGQLAQRLESIKGIALALQYLHDDCRVVYRDVKPDNIGFYRKPNPRSHCGYTEIPKLFDFGLAKELKPQYLCSTHPLGRQKTNPTGDPSGFDTYNLTARSGSRRYMAPEVALSSPYNEKADVYSIGVVLYQVAALVTPFEGYSMYRHEEEVLVMGDRPNAKIPRKKRSLKKVKKSVGVSYVDWLARHKRNGEGLEKINDLLALRTKCVWTKELKDLIEECWHSDLFLRPSMKDVVERLEGCIRELTTMMPGGKSLNSRSSLMSISQETERISAISHAGDRPNWTQQ